MLQRLKDKARALKRQIGALHYASVDKRIGILPKIIIVIAVLYALSPIDLIPDFIPVLGYLDDLLILPMLIALAIRLIPKDLWEDAVRQAEQEPITLRKNWTFAVIAVVLWSLLLIWLATMLLRVLRAVSP